MSSRKTYIHPFRIIELDLHPEKAEVYEKETRNGNIIKERIPYKSNSDNLESIISYCIKNNIPASEYKNIIITACTYERSNDTYLSFEYHKPKTHKEIDDEVLQKESERLLAKIEKDKRKAEKEKQKLEKQKVIESLSEEQKRALNI